MTTRWPSLRSLMAVSTIKDKIDRIGSWVISSTIEDVPRTIVSLLTWGLMPGMVTDFDNNSKMP